MARRRRQAATKEDHHRVTMVRRVAEILDDPDAPSRFAHEGACRAGLRSAFCLAGAEWEAADAMAASIVSAALASIGARRPTWEQGQPEWCQNGIIVAERTHCARCARRIPEDAGRGRKYCSDTCRNAASQQMWRTRDIRRTWTEHLAALATKKEHNRRQREVPCEHCGKPFIRAPQHIRNQRYCSHKCYSASKVGRRRLRRKLCAGCGQKFQPRHAGKKYCSNDCFVAAKRSIRLPRSERQCPVCQSIFRPTKPSDRKTYCSKRCTGIANQRLRVTPYKAAAPRATDEETSDPPPMLLAAE